MFYNYDHNEYDLKINSNIFNEFVKNKINEVMCINYSTDRLFSDIKNSYKVNCISLLNNVLVDKYNIKRINNLLNKSNIDKQVEVWSNKNYIKDFLSSQQDGKVECKENNYTDKYLNKEVMNVENSNQFNLAKDRI